MCQDKEGRGVVKGLDTNALFGTLISGKKERKFEGISFSHVWNLTKTEGKKGLRKAEEKFNMCVKDLELSQKD